MVGGEGGVGMEGYRTIVCQEGLGGGRRIRPAKGEASRGVQ